MEEARNREQETSEEMSIIGAGIDIAGNIAAADDLHLLGRVTGDVRCATLILGENSVVRGNVQAERIRAAGTIEGSIDTKDLAVEPTARIVGDVTYSRIRIANGGIVSGKMIYRASEEEAGDAAKLRLVEPAPAASKAKAQPVFVE